MNFFSLGIMNNIFSSQNVLFFVLRHRNFSKKSLLIDRFRASEEYISCISKLTLLEWGTHEVTMLCFGSRNFLKTFSLMKKLSHLIYSYKAHFYLCVCFNFSETARDTSIKLGTIDPLPMVNVIQGGL